MKVLIQFLFLIQASVLIGQDFNYTYFNQLDFSFSRTIFFVDEEIGYSPSASGKVFKSTDGGETWMTTELVNDLPIYDIQFIDEKYGFAVGGKSSCSPTPCDIPGSRIFRTIDGGDSWTETTLDEREFYTLHFIDKDTGFVGGLGTLYKTIDGGESWTPIVLDQFYNIRELKFIDGVGYFSSLFGQMLKSIDGGETWFPLNTEITSHIYAFDFVNANLGYAGGQSDFIKTTDGGVTWQTLPNAPIEVYSVTSLTHDYVIASGKGKYTGGDLGITLGGIFFSTDGGATWQINDTLEITSAVHTHFVSEQLGFGVGGGNTILKLTNNAVTNTSTELDIRKSNWVFPNPTDGIIYFNDIDFLEGSRVCILNIDGQKLIEENISSNGLDIRELKSGLYIYQIYHSDSNEVIYGNVVKQ